MVRTTVTRSIQAPAEVVFRAVSDVRNLPETVPDIVGVEILGAAPGGGGVGVGTRFRERRLMNGREMATDLEITELVENDRVRQVRMVAESHGTVWDTLFTVCGDGERAELELVMDAKAHKLLPRLLNPIMKGMFRKGLVRHVDAVKAYCESGARGTA